MMQHLTYEAKAHLSFTHRALDGAPPGNRTDGKTMLATLRKYQMFCSKGKTPVWSSAPLCSLEFIDKAVAQGLALRKF